MKFPPLLVAAVCSLLFLFCKKKESDCKCLTYEDCIEDKCVLQKNAYRINNVGITGYNLYHGVVKGSACLDTLVFDIGRGALEDRNKFALFLHLKGYGVYDIAPSLTTKISDDEYIIGSAAVCCHQFGENWNAAYIHCKVHKDSVNMKIKFLSDAQEPDDPPLDSCQVTLYK
jgi:hypothetical protein